MTAPSTIQHLLSRVLMLVPGVSDGAALDALRRKLVEFCRQTGAWRKDLTITIVANTSAYALDPSAGSSIERIAALTDPLGFAYDPRNYRYDADAGEIVLRSTIGNAVPGETLTVTAVIVPDRWDADEVYPERIMRYYGDGIASGAAADLLATSGKPWTNYDAAAVAKVEYGNAVSRAISDRMRGGTERNAGIRP